MGKMINTVTVNVTTVGADGAATGAGTTVPLNGELLDIYCNWHASAPAGTTDLTITETTFGTILAKSNAVTDIRYAPRMVCHGADAAALTWYDRYPLSDSVLTFTVAQSNALTNCLVATVRYVTTF